MVDICFLSVTNLIKNIKIRFGPAATSDNFFQKLQ